MKSLNDIAMLLRRAGVDYALIGGHAVNLVLEPRFTADVDITINADVDAWTRLNADLLAAGFRVERTHGADQPSGPDFVRFVDDVGTTIELQTAKTALQRTAIARAIDHDGIRVASPEDLIVFKAIANRPKDQIDLLGLTRLPNIDWSYVDHQARDWGVDDVIARVRALAASSG
jgi:predicted nucleotidyltransferase